MSIKRISLFMLVMLLIGFRPHVVESQVQIQGPRNAEDVYSGVVYGPIDATDTLWRIASRYKQDAQFSVYQTMLAIYELNPQAFENQNFNTMVNGATLRLPSDRYIARMNPQHAKAKAEADDHAFGRANSVQPTNEAGQISAENLKPEVPLVNQEDLSNTQRQLQSQLNALNRQQNAQFGAIKDQVSSSIDSVQALLDENKRLYARLDQVNNDIADLRNKVEGDVQDQIDEQLVLQKELIALVKEAQQRQLEKESESIWTKLTSTTGIILLSTGFTLVVLIALAIWLLRRPSGGQAPEKETQLEKAKESNDIVDDELVIGEIDDAASAEADELMAALEAELPVEDSDDILGEQLEDGLDEIKVDDIDDFGDLDDEMLVPNATDNEIDKTDTVDTGEVNFDAESIDLDDDEMGNESINLSDDEDEDTSAAKTVETDSTDLESLDLEEQDGQLSAADEETSTEDNASNNPDADSIVGNEETSNNDEDNALEIDGLTEQGDDDDGMPTGVSLNEDGEIDENTIDQIEQQIHQKDEEINQLTDEILSDLESVADDDTPLEADEQPEAITDIDDLLEQNSQPSSAVNRDEALDENTESDDDPIDTSEADSDSIQKEAEGSSEIESKIDSANVEGDDEIVDPDELLAELSDQVQEESNDLSDELVAELSEDELASQELDELLEEFTNDDGESNVSTQGESSEAVDPQTDASVSDVDSEEIDLEAEALPIDSTDSLANDLLEELTEENEVKDELDSLLEEMGEANDAEESDQDFIDDLLDDIPSLSDNTDEGSESAPTDAEQADDTDKQIEPKTNDEALSDDDDFLADLPDLDEWLDEETASSDGEALDDGENSESDDLAAIAESDFDSILAEIDDVADILDEEDAPSAFNEEKSPAAPELEEEIDASGLDLHALMSENEKDPDFTDPVEDFVDVDDLIIESDVADPKTDNDLALDLGSSLDKLKENDNLANKPETLDVDQAGNLDLAQVYIDMEDYEAASEVLNEVIENGSDEQINEAKELLASIQKQ
ncbi:FimV/HubP family polar landmark protein [Agaribacter flavus]|uniref:FimV/HubP family polar landmark protein n=1 Tax=Agaribacter flavus TaxID=1902781 RepID=A0ABV7FN03_9ALTE